MKKQKPVNNKRPPTSVPVQTFLINIMSDGQVTVPKFPNDFVLANRLMEEAHRYVNANFLDHARAGKVNERGVIDGSNLVVTNRMPGKP